MVHDTEKFTKHIYTRACINMQGIPYPRAVHKIMRLLVFLFLGVSQSWGLRLHSYFTPGMMMQRDVPTKVWGFDLVGDLATTELACQEAGHVGSGPVAEMFVPATWPGHVCI